MRDLASKRQNGKEPVSVTLRLNHIHDLFAMPRYNAFQDNYLPLSGIDQIALQLRYARLRNGLHVTFILPESDDKEPNPHAEIQAALQRYCNIRLDNLLVDLMARRLTVVRSLQVGVLILGVSLALAATISRAEGIVEWLRQSPVPKGSLNGCERCFPTVSAFLVRWRCGHPPMHSYLVCARCTTTSKFTVRFAR